MSKASRCQYCFTYCFTIAEPVIIGRDILENNIHVHLDNDRVTFSRRKDVNLSDKSSNLDFKNIDTDLRGDDELALIKILKKYSEFFTDGIPTRRVKTGVLRIDLIDPNKTVQRHPYRLAPAEKEIVNEKIESLLKAGVIRESNSPFASPILLVKKKDNTDRMCVDYRGYDGLVEVVNEAEEAETAEGHNRESEKVTSDNDSDTVSISSSHTMTASSGTLSASERDE